MAREIWLAPILSDNRDRLLERASEVLATGPAEALLYLVPSRPLLELAAGRLLDGARVRGVWGSLPVHLFRGFARFVLATAVEVETGLPLAPRIAIDQEDLPVRRSIISQIIKRLAREGRLKAIAPLAHSDGCVNTIAKLIGEIQRAAVSAAELQAIVDARARDQNPASDQDTSDTSSGQGISLQIDFDREIALLYSAYAAALEGFGLTDDDADQLRALEVLRGEVDGKQVSLPWLSDVRLLVVDGFSDFTPVQGEILRLLIPQISNVVVNLNRDERNAEIFRPFDRTVDQLSSMAEFAVHYTSDTRPMAGALSPLRERLFNPFSAAETSVEAVEDISPAITLLDCGNRLTEVRAIAKEIKRLVLIDGFRPSEIAMVVRRRATYEETISQVFDQEGIPSTLGRRIELQEVPAVRAALKLFEALITHGRDNAGSIKVSDIADLVKSGYFSLSDTERSMLLERFEREPAKLIEWSNRGGPDDLDVRRAGHWDVDELENVIAYVGGELRADRWVRRARQLAYQPHRRDVTELPEREPDDELDFEDEATPAPGEQPAAQIRRVEFREPLDVPLPGSERRPKTAKDVHPALMAWSALIVERFAGLIEVCPRNGSAQELRDGLLRLLEQLQFASEIRGADRGDVSDAELPRLTLDLRGLEGLRRAIRAAARSIEIADRVVTQEESPTIHLATLLDETVRCVRAQSLVTAHGDPDGLKVLEATDVRGLRFRAVFIAGLVEGGFPLRPGRDWIYPHEEREQLKRYGLTLEDISPDTLLKEEHYFYQPACRATERLYLSRPLVLEDGAETVASYFVQELSRAIAPVKIRKEIVRSDFEGRGLFDSSRPSELAVLLVRQEQRLRHRAQRDGNFPAEVIARLMAVAVEQGVLTESARDRIAIERERNSRRFGQFDGAISSTGLIAKLNERYGAVHPFSASELSLYGKCPFKFYAEKVLKLDPRGEAAIDLTALDAGSLLHEILRRFFERHRRERLTEFDRAGLRRELGEVADEVFDEHQRSVPPLNPQVWRIDRESRKLMLEQLLDYEVELQQKSLKDVRPAHFELAFGMKGDAVDVDSTEQRLKITRGALDQPESISVRGQIDRVDIANDGTAIAYDYKLSRGAGIDDMREGRALQLHIYLAALEQLLMPESTIAGGGYYTIKGAKTRRNQGLYRVGLRDYTGVGKTTDSSVDDAAWKAIREEMQTRIWEFVDGMRAGDFKVAPSAPDSTCPHCDYSAVCRYEKFRIRRKEEED